MHNIKIKQLYDHLLLKFSKLPYDNQNRSHLRRLERSLNMLYPYEFIHDQKGVPNYNLKSIIFDVYGYDLNIVRKHLRAVYLNDKIIRFKTNYTWIYDVEELCYKGIDANGELFIGYYVSDQEFVNRWLSVGDDLKRSSPFIYNECQRIVNAETQRRKRLRKRINGIVSNGNAYFVTLTFNDDTLSNTSYETRRQIVSRFLNTISSSYVGNVDYGKLNGREHYHAVIQTDKLNGIVFEYDRRYGSICKYAAAFDEWSKRGFYSIKTCGTSDTDHRRLAAYTTKLVNHAIKETTKRCALIYSR